MWHDSICNTVQEPTVTSTIVAKKTTTWGESGFPSEFLGWLDQDGYLYFVDRKKDIIRRRGENISSQEVENVLKRHPEVLDCAVLAVPSELGEDEVKAYLNQYQGGMCISGRLTMTERTPRHLISPLGPNWVGTDSAV